MKILKKIANALAWLVIVGCIWHVAPDIKKAFESFEGSNIPWIVLGLCVIFVVAGLIYRDRVSKESKARHAIIALVFVSLINVFVLFYFGRFALEMLEFAEMVDSSLVLKTMLAIFLWPFLFTAQTAYLWVEVVRRRRRNKQPTAVTAKAQDVFNNLKAAMFRRCVCPPRDALTVFIPEGEEPSPEVQAILDAVPSSRWYPLDGGELVNFPNTFESYDEHLFDLDPHGWDHEHCDRCNGTINAGDTCWVADIDETSCHMFCEACFENLGKEKAQ